MANMTFFIQNNPMFVNYTFLMRFFHAGSWPHQSESELCLRLRRGEGLRLLRPRERLRDDEDD